MVSSGSANDTNEDDHATNLNLNGVSYFALKKGEVLAGRTNAGTLSSNR